MSYLDRVLQPDEAVRYRGTLHWVVYLPAIVIAVLAIVAGALVFRFTADRNTSAIAAAAGLALALLMFLSAWFRRWTTEIAVTDRRIIFKQGFISRHTVETHMDKVESVDVNQGLWGRLLNYGDVIIHGTGAGREPMRLVESPLEFRNCITAR